MSTPVLADGGMGPVATIYPLAIIGAAIFFIIIALRDGQNKNAKTRSLPTSPLSRQFHAAVRRQRPERSTGPSSERPGRRFGAPSLQVMEGGEAAEGDRPTVPRRFAPAPPRRKSG